MRHSVTDGRRLLRSGRAVGAVSVVWLPLMVAGCAQPCPPRQVDRLEWSPAYWKGCLAEGVASRPVVAKRAMRLLAYRSNFEGYWKLVDCALRWGPVAERAILVERLPGHGETSYWCLLIVESEGTLKYYASTMACLACVLPAERRGAWQQEEAMDSARSGTSRRGVSLFRDTVDSVLQVGRSGVLAPGGDSPVVDLGPMAIHLYRRRDRAAADFLVENMILSPGVIRGAVGIRDIPRTRNKPSAEEMQDDVWERRTPGQRMVWREHYAQTFHARAAANAALSILLRQDVAGELGLWEETGAAGGG